MAGSATISSLSQSPQPPLSTLPACTITHHSSYAAAAVLHAHPLSATIPGTLSFRHSGDLSSATTPGLHSHDTLAAQYLATQPTPSNTATATQHMAAPW